MDINPQNNYDFDFNSNTIENNNQVSAEYFPRGQHTWSEPTLWDVDSEGASGNLLPSKGHVDGVRSLQDGNIGAPENTVAFVLQDNLHCIPPTVRIHNDDAYISSTRPWWTDRPTDNRTFRHWWKNVTLTGTDSDWTLQLRWNSSESRW